MSRFEELLGATAEVLDKAEKAVDRERASSALVDLLDDFDESDLRGFVSDLEAFLDAIEEAASAGNEWRDAEDREEKSDAREAFLEALSEMVDKHADLDPGELTEAPVAPAAVKRTGPVTEAELNRAVEIIAETSNGSTAKYAVQVRSEFAAHGHIDKLYAAIAPEADWIIVADDGEVTLDGRETVKLDIKEEA